MTTLTLEEMETHLSMAADDRHTWAVYSDDPVMIRRLESIGATFVRETHGGGRHYTLPDNQVTLRKARKPMSAARMAELSTQLAAARTKL